MNLEFKWLALKTHLNYYIKKLKLKIFKNKFSKYLGICIISKKIKSKKYKIENFLGNLFQLNGYCLKTYAQYFLKLMSSTQTRQLQNKDHTKFKLIQTK